MKSSSSLAEFPQVQNDLKIAAFLNVDGKYV